MNWRQNYINVFKWKCPYLPKKIQTLYCKNILMMSVFLLFLLKLRFSFLHMFFLYRMSCLLVYDLNLDPISKHQHITDFELCISASIRLWKSYMHKSGTDMISALKKGKKGHILTFFSTLRAKRAKLIT